jgi:hypothetical protein
MQCGSMPSAVSTGFLCVLALAVGAVSGCGGDDDGAQPGTDAAVDAGEPDAAAPDAAVAPIFRNPVDLPDDELGAQVMALLGAPVEGAEDNCNRCHGVTRQNLRYWRALGDRALSDCLTDLTVDEPAAARAMLDCLRAEPADPESAFQAEKLGVYATATHLDWFAYVFRLAYGADGAEAHEAFVDRVGMPRGNQAAIDQADFDLIAEYFGRGLPRLDAILVEEPRPTECTPGISAEVAAHVAEMSTAGWRAVNAENDILMHGCAEAGSPRDCLADEPRVPEWESLAGTAVRRLATVDYASSYWTRSSADGRFVAHGVEGGGDFSAAFIDLQSDKVIPADALYDPGFFPDNSGFAFQPPAHFCEESVLTAAPDEVTFEEPGCTTVGQVGLYQHVGAALGGGDYWAVDSQFVSDNGGHDASLSDPNANFSANARSSLTPMIHTGGAYQPGDSVNVPNPYEGDSVLSPSARLLITRVAGNGSRQLGFVLRSVVATPTPSGYDIELPEVGRYCVNGGKPGFSYDERWIAYHHYVEAADAVELGFSGPDDPDFAPYLEQGAANVYLLDLVTGETRRVTGMAAGEYALYPHFRSDGWIYFIVRQLDTPGETVAATDAALVLESPTGVPPDAPQSGSRQDVRRGE